MSSMNRAQTLPPETWERHAASASVGQSDRSKSCNQLEPQVYDRQGYDFSGPPQQCTFQSPSVGGGTNQGIIGQFQFPSVTHGPYAIPAQQQMTNYNQQHVHHQRSNTCNNGLQQLPYAVHGPMPSQFIYQAYQEYPTQSRMDSYGTYGPHTQQPGTVYQGTSAGITMPMPNWAGVPANRREPVSAGSFQPGQFQFNERFPLFSPTNSIQRPILHLQQQHSADQISTVSSVCGSRPAMEPRERLKTPIVDPSTGREIVSGQSNKTPVGVTADARTIQRQFAKQVAETLFVPLRKPPLGDATVIARGGEFSEKGMISPAAAPVVDTQQQTEQAKNGRRDKMVAPDKQPIAAKNFTTGNEAFNEAVETLLGMGFSMDVICRKMIRLTSDDFSSTQNIIDAMLHLDELDRSTTNTTTNTATTERIIPSGRESLEAALEAHYPSSGSVVSSTLANPPAAATSTKPNPPNRRNRLKKKNQLSQQSSTGNGHDGKPAICSTADKQRVDKQTDLSRVDEAVGGVRLEDPEKRSLLEENRILKDSRLCKVCMDAEVNTVFIPCGHLACCHSCSVSRGEHGECPICRQHIKEIVRTFLT